MYLLYTTNLITCHKSETFLFAQGGAASKKKLGRQIRGVS